MRKVLLKVLFIVSILFGSFCFQQSDLKASEYLSVQVVPGEEVEYVKVDIDGVIYILVFVDGVLTELYPELICGGPNGGH